MAASSTTPSDAAPRVLQNVIVRKTDNNMITRTVYTRNKGTGNQVWVFLRYNPTDRIYRIHAGYSHCRPETDDWYSEERVYRLHEYLQDHPEWEMKIRQLQEEIENTHQHPTARSA